MPYRVRNDVLFVLMSYSSQYQDDNYICGVFSSREEAEKHLKIGVCYSPKDEHGYYNALSKATSIPTDQSQDCFKTWGGNNHCKIFELELDVFIPPYTGKVE